MRPILSIVIPVYNVEKYIRKCILSIISQKSFNNEVEVIIVNDGTPDNSLNIIKDLCNCYTNIIVINQSNKGLSEARNTGLRHATGKFVWFVDSDDSIIDGSLYKIIQILKSSNFDILAILMVLVYQDNDVTKKLHYNKHLECKEIIRGADYLFEGGDLGPTQQYIFSLDFLKDNNLLFYPGIYHEDGEFDARALYLCQRLRLSNIYAYNYLQRGNSIMTSMSCKNFNDLITVYDNLLSFGNEKVFKNDTKDWSALAASLIMPMFSWTARFNNTEEFKKIYESNSKKIRKGILNLIYLRHLKWFHLKLIVCILVFPKIYMKYLNRKTK